MRIQELKLSEISEAKLISDSELGNDFISSAQFENYIHSPLSTIIGASIESKLIGFLIAYQVDHTFLKSHFNQTQFSYFKNIIHSQEKYILLKTIAIHPSFQNQKIGTNILTCYLNELKSQKKYSKLFAIAWKVENKVKIGKIFDELNFNPLKHINDFWYQESVELNYQCILCGNPPCKCHALLYEKNI